MRCRWYSVSIASFSHGWPLPIPIINTQLHSNISRNCPEPGVDKNRHGLITGIYKFSLQFLQFFISCQIPSSPIAMTVDHAFEGRISKAAFIVRKTQSTLCTPPPAKQQPTVGDDFCLPRRLSYRQHRSLLHSLPRPKGARIGRWISPFRAPVSRQRHRNTIYHRGYHVRVRGADVQRRPRVRPRLGHLSPSCKGPEVS